jgi:3-oxoacyl-[acyl-carrier protein] reductase
MTNVFVSNVLEGKVALVTGASRGIGAAIASALAQAGAKVIGTATTVKGADQISENLKNKGRGAVLDITNTESSIALISDILAKEEALDIVINNAGITNDNLLARMKESAWDDVINANLNGTYRICRHVLKPMMKQRYGRIINISSVVGLTGNPGQTNYAASKAGVIGFTKSLAKEVGSRNITANVIAPGFIQTDMTDALTTEQVDKMLSQVPLKRLGEAQEIGALVVYLASDSASYITGETININGGMLMN